MNRDEQVGGEVRKGTCVRMRCRSWRQTGQLVLAALVVAAPAAGQAVTTGAVEGTVVPAAGSALELSDVAVTAIHEATGHRWRVAADEDGRYFLENLAVGGPYRLEVSAPGYESASRLGLRVNLGQRLRVDFAVAPAVVELEGVTVTAVEDPRLNPGRTGPAQTVDRSSIERLPVLDRDVLDLAHESPLVTRTEFGLSIAGHDPRSTSLRIDGGVNDNLFGRFSATPGGLLNLVALPGGGGVRAIPLDAVQELQVVVSPFDVRWSGFGGGLINAVTRSGTNELQGSLFGSVQDDALVGEDVDGVPSATFRTLQFGGTLAGPLVRNRIHGFVAVDLQNGDVPYDAARIGPDTTGGADSVGIGIRLPSVLRFQSLLKDRYGVDAGDFGPVDTRNPAGNVFAKLTAQLGTNSLLEVSQSWAHGVLEGFFVDRETYGAWDLSSADIRFGNTTLATRANWNAVFADRFSNELTLARLDIDDSCRPASRFPVVEVAVDEGRLRAGDKFSCSPAALEQGVLELTDNLTFSLGAQRLTVGAHVEWIDFDVTGTADASGTWRFDDLDALEQATPAEYRRTLAAAGRTRGPGFELGARQVGVYVQDQWHPAAEVTLTAGVRVDVPSFAGRPGSNPVLRAELGHETSTIPQGAVLWSPRLGINWDVGGAGVTSVRGGAGLFVSRPVYFLIGEAYRATGLEELTLSCSGDETPSFTLDPSRQPVACRTGAAVPIPQITFFDPHFRFPQDLKLAAGLDHRLPGGLVATVDLLYTRAVHQAFYEDVNLLPPAAVVSGEGGRALYGTIDPTTGGATPLRRSDLFGAVIPQTNRDGDEAIAATAQLQGRVGSRVTVNASYTWSRARSLQALSGLGLSLTGLGVAADQIASTPLDGTLEEPNLRPSLADLPHRMRMSGAVQLPRGFAVGLIYDGGSGDPYTWVVEGDANADGFGVPFFNSANNDAVYVPRRSAADGDVSLVVVDPETGGFVPAPASEYETLESLIASESCLRRQRGQILRRNSCRDPWQDFLNLRVSKLVTLGRGPSLEITADLFNVPNFLDREGGLIRRTAFSGFENVSLLGLRGFDVEKGRGVYELVSPDPRAVDVGASRWRAQLGMRYVF